MKTPIFKNVFFQIFISMICIYTSMSILFNNDHNYRIIAVLPIVFLVSNYFLIFVLVDDVFYNIGYFLFYIQFFIKCVISPLFLLLGHYKSNFHSLNADYIEYAVYLMAYEMIACSLVVYFTKEKSISNRKIKIVMANHSLHTTPFIIFIALILLFFWMFIPSIRNNYISIFDLINSKSVFNGVDYTDQFVSGSSNRIATTLFLVLFGSMRLVIPLYIIQGLKEKYDNLISFIASLFIVFIQFMFIPGTLLTAFIIAFILLTYMMRLYKKFQKMTMIVIFCSFAFVMLLLYIWFNYSLIWTRYSSISDYISIQLQSYFPGVCNVASIFRVVREDRIKTLFDSIIACVPFQSSIFGKSLFSHDLNNIFGATNGLKSQIVSTIGGGWYIFGPVFAPVFSVFFTRVSLINGYKYKRAQNEWRRILYLYMCIQTMLGIGIYNIQTTITNWIQVGVVLLIFSIIEGERTQEGFSDVVIPDINNEVMQ